MKRPPWLRARADQIGRWLQPGSTAIEKILDDAGTPAAKRTAPRGPGPRPFRMRPYNVTACRWDGTEARARDLCVWFPELQVVVVGDAHPLSLKPKVVLLNLPGPDGKSMQARDHAWLVRGSEGGCFFASDEEFVTLYEPSGLWKLRAAWRVMTRRFRRSNRRSDTPAEHSAKGAA